MKREKNTAEFKSPYLRSCATWIAGMLIWTCGEPKVCAGDIYKYVDTDGVVHFTNVPTSPKFKFFMGAKKKKNFHPADSNAYDDLIQNAARKYRISFALIKAVIRVESGFNPKAVSKQGARGLMQIMPENDKALSLSNPFDPTQNIMAGTQYLRRMLDRYDNSLSLALAAYNAGPGAVDKYRRIPPFKETQNYVEKVMALYKQYKNA